MEKLPQDDQPREVMPPKELAALREVLRELVADLPGTIARYHESHPEEARRYREAQESVIKARREGEKWGVTHYIL